MFHIKKLFLLFLFLFQTVNAEVVVNPESHHKQFLTYGHLFEPQTTLLFRSGVRGWGGVGGSTALFEFPKADLPSQLVMHASINTSYQVDDSSSTVHVETNDVRVGLAYDFNFSSDERAAIIWTHQSGHIADNVPDLDLIGPDLGNEVFDFRYIKDVEHTWRFGGGLRPFVISSPQLPFFGAEQFVEWFPNGVASSPQKFSKFIALGFEEYGYASLEVSSHLQLGYVAGNHFDPKNTQVMRVVFGAYAGMDPRMKYFQFKHRRDSFFYAGTIFDF